MTISLRPNSRASIDQTPGPMQMKETAITADNADVIGVTIDSVLVLANQENPATTATTAAPRATYRVKKPISSSKPTAPTTTRTIHPRNPGSPLLPTE